MPVENFILTLKTPSLHGKIVNVAPTVPTGGILDIDTIRPTVRANKSVGNWNYIVRHMTMKLLCGVTCVFHCHNE